MRLGGASIAPGESLRIDGVWTTVIGIVPSGFQGTEPATVHAWLPLDQMLRSSGWRRDEQAPRVVVRRRGLQCNRPAGPGQREIAGQSASRNAAGSRRRRSDFGGLDCWEAATVRPSDCSPPSSRARLSFWRRLP